MVSVENGVGLDVYTSLPGLQLYTGNFIEHHRGKGGAGYKKHSGVCLETQFFPDSPHQPAFPSALLRAGEEYSHETVWRFFTE